MSQDIFTQVPSKEQEITHSNFKKPGCWQLHLANSRPIQVEDREIIKLPVKHRLTGLVKSVEYLLILTLLHLLGFNKVLGGRR